MIQLALNFANLSIPAFIERCRAITVAMAGNPNFTTPVPSLESVNAAIDTLETSYQEGLNGSHAAKKLQKTQRIEANALMQQLKVYVQTISGDDNEIAFSSGMTQKRSGERHNEISPPQNVRVHSLAASGSAQSLWNGVPHRRSYLVYITSDLADVWNRTKWTLLGTTGAPRFNTSGLIVGQKYAFIIIAVGARNIQSAPSDPAILTAA